MFRFTLALACVMGVAGCRDHDEDPIVAVPAPTVPDPDPDPLTPVPGWQLQGLKGIRLTAVSGLDADHAWASSMPDGLFDTVDGGATWTKTPHQSYARLQFLNPHEGWARGF